MLSEKLGRGYTSGHRDYAVSSPGVGWYAGPAYVCVGTRHYSRGLVQRVTLNGDTSAGRAYYLTPITPPSYAGPILARGNKLVVAGDVMPTGQAGQARQIQLTCSDTLGHIRWQHSYPRLPSALDYSSAITTTPRGGYLISGEANNFAGFGYNPYVLETDSLGNFRRSRTLLPLGPGYNDCQTFQNQSNVITLPNGGGYLITGTVDSTYQLRPQSYLGYIMRLDTALNVMWVYRHPPALAGTGATQNYAYRLRLLPNNTVGLLLTDVRGAGTPDALLTQVRLDNGQRVGFYILSSNTQTVVIPFDWQWVGDGTLLLAGESRQLGVANPQSYLARWDFSRTPLAARTAEEASALATFYCYPNPATGPVTVNWQLPVGQRAGQVRLYSVLGQLVRTVTLPATASGKLEVSGLAAGLYVARLMDAGGALQGYAQRLEVRE